MLLLLVVIGVLAMIYSARLISATPPPQGWRPPPETPAVGEEGWPNVSTQKLMRPTGDTIWERFHRARPCPVETVRLAGPGVLCKARRGQLELFEDE